MVRAISWPLSNGIAFPPLPGWPDGWRPGRRHGATAVVAGLRPSDRWPFRPVWLDLAWVGFSLLNLAAIVIFQRWERIGFHLIWISVTLLYGLRIWPARQTLWVLAAVSLGTFAATGTDVLRHTEPPGELTEVPLVAAMFSAMVWHARGRLAADSGRARVREQNARLLATQRRFLRDAPDQLRTPGTIALGHAEFPARELAGQQQHDIHVVAGELTRLRILGERLLIIAAAENPDSLHPGPVALDEFIGEAFGRWQPTAPRDWQLGQLAPATAGVDRARLGLAVDALLENAVQHTGPDDLIRLSVCQGDKGDKTAVARIVIEDGGAGIPQDELARIFDRFRTGSAIGTPGGTGLGLALVRSIVRGHHGEVRVHSAVGAGSKFELMLPAITAAGGGPSGVPAPSPAGQPLRDWLPW